ncbi:MAG TPA: carbamoyltransferase HypF [Thermoanaerobaculia bacterium]|jgi:hydrogenase maturation protein HypF|nr:carbamoyltransferase HypF [Thermoanaerobaculia bacterium]
MPPDQLSDSADSPIRHRVTVGGIVQGVGFRPFVFSLAARHGLAGTVRNVAGGVAIEIEGSEPAVAAFERALSVEAPPLAALDEIRIEPLPLGRDVGFTIEKSDAAAAVPTPVSPDVAVCDACLAELFDPADRRYRYPFINCTDCGPRFTIIESLPYDRPKTTMGAFSMCPRCQAEYDDPGSRRFHAQPNACAECGPALSFVPLQPSPPAPVPEGEGGTAKTPPFFSPLPLGEGPGVRAEAASLHGEEALEATGRALDAAKIVAIKGIGGFHLACDARSDTAVAELRLRKGRGDKPFAVMVPSLEVARQVARLELDEERLLASRERPIVLVARHPPGEGLPISDLVAPGQATLGLLLPYSPLHHLLLAGRILVMTSGNRSEEPICRENDEALERLGPLTDAFLLHDREIHAVCDDSVVRVFTGRELPLRRSRGYAPYPLRMPYPAPPTLAVGAELKATFCLAHERRAFLSQHIGDLGNWETLVAFERMVEHLSGLFRIDPERIACDLHPDYLSTRWAERRAAERGLPLLRIQHHHAHIAAVMAENGLAGDRPVLGASFDGTGYGLDGAIWGGEILLADYARAERLAHLRYTPLPGGDAAIRHPARMALAHLAAAGIEWHPQLPCVAATPEPVRRILARQVETGFGTVPTSSMGRLFDAVAALAGLCFESRFEGQAAMALETAAAEGPGGEFYRFALRDEGHLLLDPAPLLAAVVRDRLRNESPGRIAARFHAAVADALVAACVHGRKKTGVATVALSGGVFQNVLLLRLAVDALARTGFEVLTHRKVPPNDGGLAYGQAVIAANAAT